MKRRALACLYPALYIVALYIVESPASAQDKSIHVGPNVLVSVAHQKYSMGEVLLAADLEDPNHLLGCGIVYAESENRRWTVVYLSTDGGRSWQSTLETKRFEDSADPACGLGRNGFAFHATLGLNASNKTEFNYFLGSYRSLDGGKTWSQQNVIPLNFEGLDRESVTIDRTRKNSDDRVYITGECAVPSLEGPSKNGFAVWRSRDLGMTFEGPVKRASAPNHYLLGVGNSVVLSDGTLVSLFGDVKNSDGHFVPPANAEESNALLEVVTTKSDGASISQATKIDDFFMDTRPGN